MTPSIDHRSLSPRFRRALLAIALTLVTTLGTWLSGSLPAAATGVYDMPPFDPQTWVLDRADLFSRLTQGSLEKSLREVANNTGTEIRFVTFRRLDYGETIDSFTQELFDTWFPDAADRANQVLMVFDAVTNDSAIQVGEAAKATLTDDIANSVAQETLRIPIRDGNYNEAFIGAKNRLATVLAGEPDPGPPVIVNKISVERTFKTADETDRGSSTKIVVILLILATVIPMVTYFAYVR